MTNEHIGCYFLDTLVADRRFEKFVCFILIYSFFTVGAHSFNESVLIPEEKDLLEKYLRMSRDYYCRFEAKGFNLKYTSLRSRMTFRMISYQAIL